MKSSAKSINLTSFDDLFSTEESRAEESCEKVVRIPLAELHPFPNHPFHVRDDEAMQNTVDSIREYGVLTPGIVRPRKDGGYEIVAGHRRKHGSELAGLSDMPCIVREMDDDTATILMVDSNIQREDILPSERAQAYKMKMEALKRQGARSDLTSPQVASKFRADDEVAKAAGVSGDTVRRFVRLTELQPELQQMVDDKKIAMTPAVELSYLKPEEQQMLLTAIDSEQATPSLSQAQRMKKLSQAGELNDDTMLDIMMEQKKPEKCELTFSGDVLRKYFPRSYTPQRMQETIIKLLEAWVKNGSAIRNDKDAGLTMSGYFYTHFSVRRSFMNKKEQLKRLICALYRQDEPEDYTDECMEDMLDNIDFEVLLQAVAHSAKTVYAYEACGVQDCSFNYRSAPLFPQKVVRLYEDIVKFVTEAVICARTMEVWLLEDLTLAIVSNYSVLSGGEFTTEYRTVKAWEFQKGLLCIEPDTLTEKLIELCAPFYSHYDQTYYEL